MKVIQHLCSCGEIAPNKKSDLCPKCMHWKLRGKLDAYIQRAKIAEQLRKDHRNRRKVR
jgi:Zn-finger nucleic acid-binding protein